MRKEEFFDSYEEAVDAMSECDAVLTTAGEWDGGTEFIGKFAPANEIGGKYFDASGVEFWMDSDSGWIIAKSDNQWTIHNNTLPLCDLSDKQAAQLFNAWRGGADRQVGIGPGLFIELEIGAHTWNKKLIYRIEPKSDRKIFIEQVEALNGSNDADASILAGMVFDAIKSGQIKAPEADE